MAWQALGGLQEKSPSIGRRLYHGEAPGKGNVDHENYDHEIERFSGSIPIGAVLKVFRGAGNVLGPRLLAPFGDRWGCVFQKTARRSKD